MRRRWIIALLLAAATLSLYWPVRHFDLIYFDDPLLLDYTPEIRAGLTVAGVKWALASVVIANWQPVTNLSFLLVSQFFGVAPGAHHLANALLHAANAALLFLLLWQLTNATWRSAIAAAVFAWHPLRVESVAWISERKDVLCAFFFLLALLFYVRFAQESKIGMPAGAGRRRRGGIYYAASLFAFVLALLSKPMAVTLPCVLLLLDVWPLRTISNLKFEFQTIKPLLLEKIPFFAIMVVFCVATYMIQHDYAAMTPWDKLGLAPRVATAISGYVAYLGKLFWPFNLAVIYPYPGNFDVSQTVLKAALLVSISLACLTQLARRPWLAVGWFWYVGTALPVIGIVQVGEQAMADRYTYLPLIGPVVALVWQAAELLSSVRKSVLMAAALVVLAMLFFLAERQLQFWRGTISLFGHNLAVTPGNGSAENTLGLGFEHAGDIRRAAVCYRAAEMMAPHDFQNRRDLAELLARQGCFAAAEKEYRSLIADEPTECINYLALAALLDKQGRAGESLDLLEECVRMSPDCVDALNNLAWALATSPRTETRNGPRAVTLAQRACELTQYHKAIFIGTLAAAQAESGRFDDAIAAAQRACAVAADDGETNLLQRNRQLIERYRAHKTAREE